MSIYDSPGVTPTEHDGSGVIRTNPDWSKRKVPLVNRNVADVWRSYMAEGASHEVAAMLTQAEMNHRTALEVHNLRVQVEHIADSVRNLGPVAEAADRILELTPLRLVGFARQLKMISDNLDKADEEAKTEEAKDFFQDVMEGRR